MNIAVDLRSLQSGRLSGVENYTLNLLDALLAMDKENRYTLFSNRFLGQSRPALADNFHFINAKTVRARYPNRLLNLGLMLRAVRLESLTGDFEVLFMPNLNQFNIRSSAKLAITVHDLSPVITPEYYDVKRNLWHKLLGFKRAFARADLIFAVSEYTKLDLIRLFKIPEQKIRVIYPGIDQKIFQPKIPVERLRAARNAYGLPGDYILFLNTIEPRKNLSGLLRAYELLRHPTDLVIVGRKGWKFRAIFREIAASKKSAHIKYIGYLEERDKPAVISLARGLVYPSFYEGFGFQPLEAMACGVPVLASQATSLPEVAGGAALLADPHNPDDIRRGIELLLTNESLRERLIAKGLEWVKKYTWQKTADQVLAGLNGLK